MNSAKKQPNAFTVLIKYVLNAFKSISFSNSKSEYKRLKNFIAS